MTKSEYIANWQKRNRAKVLGYKEKWRQANLDKVRASARKRYAANKQKFIDATRRSQKKHHDRVIATAKLYRKNNRAKVRKAQNKWQARKMLDLDFRIKKLLRGRLCMAIRAVDGAKKCARTTEMLGCSINDFRIYIESKFEVGMTWSNYGSVWHVDHIMPCAIFDLTKPEHQKRCFHFSNMQPLFVVDNLKKNRWHFSDQFNLL